MYPPHLPPAVLSSRLSPHDSRSNECKNPLRLQDATGSPLAIQHVLAGSALTFVKITNARGGYGPHRPERSEPGQG